MKALMFILTLLAFAAPVMSALLPAPVAYYPLDGNAADYSGNSLNGSALSYITTTDRNGNPAGALQFGTSSTRISCGDQPAFEFTSSFTLSAWVRQTSGSHSTYIIAKYNLTPNAYGMGLGGWSEIYGFVMNNTPNYEDHWGGNPINDGYWHAVALVFDRAAGQLRLYVDGQAIAARPLYQTYTDFQNTVPLMIGGISGQDFDGAIDDVRIYDVALTSGEVSHLYVADTVGEVVYVAPGQAPSPQSYYDGSEWNRPKYIPDTSSFAAEVNSRLSDDSTSLPLKVVFHPGVYTSPGTGFIKRQNVTLEAPYGATIKLANNASLHTSGAGWLAMFESPWGDYADSITINGLTIDMNWANQSTTRATMTGYKHVALWLRTHTATVNNLTLKNFGAEDGVEAFGLNLWVPNTSYNTLSTIRTSTFRDFQAVNGGYCTAVIVCTQPPDFSNAPPDNRSVEAVLVEANSFIDLVGGTAMGVADAAHVTFYNNYVSNVMQGFNADTVTTTVIRNISISGNTFSDVGSGIDIGAPGWGSGAYAVFFDITVDNNTFFLSGWQQLNSTYWEESFGVRMSGGCRDIWVTSNSFQLASFWSAFTYPPDTLFDTVVPGFDLHYRGSGTTFKGKKRFWPVRYMLSTETYGWQSFQNSASNSTLWNNTPNTIWNQLVIEP